LYCVLFNDYVDSKFLPAKRLGYVPLGISDLALATVPVTTHVL
jgi:hypothetical protein